MVRLVFRPYTQIRRTICTSVSLRASTRVSPGFTLFRHRSPSFGPQQICSYSNLSQANDRSIVPPTRGQDSYLSLRKDLYFHCASGFDTQILAYMLDSLVRVSRRVEENHFVSISNHSNWHIISSTSPSNRQNFVLSRSETSRLTRPSLRAGLFLSQFQRRAPRLNNPGGKHQPLHLLRRI